MNDLDKLELQEFDTVEEEVQGSSTQFEINDLETANWAFRKITSFKKRIAEKEALAKVENERINNWLANETKGDKNSIERFEAMLIAYYQENKAKDKKFKLTTPYGKLRSTSKKPKVTVKDENEAVEYILERNPSAVETIYKYNKNDLKAMFTVVEKENGFLSAIDENGEILSFIELETQQDSYTIKTEEEK